jgi:hypothetical protein
MRALQKRSAMQASLYKAMQYGLHGMCHATKRDEEQQTQRGGGGRM